MKANLPGHRGTCSSIKIKPLPELELLSSVPIDTQRVLDHSDGGDLVRMRWNNNVCLGIISLGKYQLKEDRVKCRPRTQAAL